MNIKLAIVLALMSCKALGASYLEKSGQTSQSTTSPQVTRAGLLEKQAISLVTYVSRQGSSPATPQASHQHVQNASSSRSTSTSQPKSILKKSGESFSPTGVSPAQATTTSPFTSPPPLRLKRDALEQSASGSAKKARSTETGASFSTTAITTPVKNSPASQPSTDIDPTTLPLIVDMIRSVFTNDVATKFTAIIQNHQRNVQQSNELEAQVAQLTDQLATEKNSKQLLEKRIAQENEKFSADLATVVRARDEITSKHDSLQTQVTNLTTHISQIEAHSTELETQLNEEREKARQAREQLMGVVRLLETHKTV
jgi:hypothetical protein